MWPGDGSASAASTSWTAMWSKQMAAVAGQLCDDQAEVCLRVAQRSAETGQRVSGHRRAAVEVAEDDVGIERSRCASVVARASM